MNNKRFNLIIHIVAWTVFLSVPFLVSPDPDWQQTLAHNHMARKEIFSYFLLLLFFYLNYYILIPRIYFSKKRIYYILSLLICFLVIVVLPEIVLQAPQHAPLGNMHGRPPMAHRPENPLAHFWFETRNNLFLFLVLTLLSFLMRVNRRLKDIEKMKKDAELQMLKSQVNPHFLFNTLNTIYALSINNSPFTSDAVLKLSGIMRYVLTEMKKDTIPLSRELEYISDYIALQRFRLGDTFNLQFHLQTDHTAYTIHPFLLIPLVENTFKHGIDPENAYSIDISLEIQEGVLQLKTRNHIVPSYSQQWYEGGLGLENLRNRLALTYPGKHTLEINMTAGEFHVLLKIRL